MKPNAAASNLGFFRRQWFLLSLAAVLIMGMSWSTDLLPLAKSQLLRDLIVAVVLFVTTLPLDTTSIRRSIRNPAPALVACALSYGLLPIIAWFVSQLLWDEWATGLLVAAAAPCTVASAAVWTRRAGGNDVVAILVTVITNLGCFVLTPLWVSVTTGQSGVAIDAVAMIRKLALLVVLPMVLGQICRRSAAVREFAIERKGWLSKLAQWGILSIVLIGAIHCGQRIRASQLSLPSLAMGLAATIVAAAVLHLSLLVIGQGIGRWMGFERPDWIAVGFAGSQKTLMVGLHVALMVGGGLTILPMIIYHTVQLVADTVIADRLAQQKGRETAR